MSLRSFLLSVTVIAILTAARVADAQPRRVQVGTLSCSVSAGIGMAAKKKYFPPDTKAGIFWLTNRMPDKWRRVQKHDVEVKRRSPDEILQGIHTKLLDLKAKGYLQGLAVPALPMRKGDGHG
jgi:hypothetical protein